MKDSQAVLLHTEFQDLRLLRRGKVRDIYEVGPYLLMVVTDRISAFDVILPDGIPGKGAVLSAISSFWFAYTKDIIKNHVISTNVEDYPQECHKYRDMLEGRSMLVLRADPLPVECIVRGYICGSAWNEYKDSGRVCGITLPAGLRESDRLPSPMFTPSTKAQSGHDINITFEQMVSIVGKDMAIKARELSIAIFNKASAYALAKGIIIADTKFEFGLCNGELILIDEAISPDSSRFWLHTTYEPGKSQDSFDKQIVRDYLLTLSWDKGYPGPLLPEGIILKTAMRYNEILQILKG